MTMQIMSLTEERVLELQRQMKDKKDDYDRLEAMGIFQIWQSDLDRFQIELEKYEIQEEKDRHAHTANVGNTGKRGGKAKAKAGAAAAKRPNAKDN